MMIPINTEIHRLTPDLHDGRQLIVTLGPPNAITLRPQGLRKEVASITAGQLWKLLREPREVIPQEWQGPVKVTAAPLNVPQREGEPLDLRHHFAVARDRLRVVLDKRGPVSEHVLQAAEDALTWALDLSLFQAGAITEEQWRAGAISEQELADRKAVTRTPNAPASH
jgi:hypothetical protein